MTWDRKPLSRVLRGFSVGIPKQTSLHRLLSSAALAVVLSLVPAFLAVPSSCALGEVFRGDAKLSDGDLAEILKELPAVTVLDLKQCRSLTEESLRPITGLAALEALILPEEGRFSDEGIKSLNRLKLREVDPAFIRKPEHFGIWLRMHRDFAESMYAGYLSLNDKPFRQHDGDRMVAELNGVSGIKELVLSTKGTTDAGLKSLVRVPDLASLVILLGTGPERITDDGIAAVSACRNLKKLHIGIEGGDERDERAVASRGQVTGAFLASFKGMDLQEVAVPTFLQTEEVFPLFLDALAEVAHERQSIHFDKPCWGRGPLWPCTNKTLRALKGRRGVHSLHITMRPEDVVEGESLQCLWAMRDLKTLAINGGSVGPDGFRGIQEAKELKVLELRDASYLTNEDLEQISRLPQLETFFIFGGPAITDEGLLHLLKCPTLREFHISRPKACKAVTRLKLERAFPVCNVHDQ